VKLLYPSEAPKRGVDPVSILPLLISALRLSNNRTISIWPEFTAYWRGVRSAYILNDFSYFLQVILFDDFQRVVAF